MREGGYAPRLTTADVGERSNADIIAKIVVLTQVVWFAVGAIARLAAGVAVTALEVHTIVHVGCAIIMYVLWWDKPYAIRRSVLLQTDDQKNIGDFFLFYNTLCNMHQKNVKQHEAKRRHYWESRAVADSHTLIDHDLPPENPHMPTIEQALEIYNTKYIDSQCGDRLESILGSLATNAAAGLQCPLDRNSNILIPLQRPGWRSVSQTSDNFALRQVWGSWTVDVGHEMSLAKLMHFVFNLLYGGGHLTAWNSSTFPTTIEAWLWRASATLVAGLFIYGSIWVLFWAAVRSRSKWLIPVRRGDLNIIMGPFFSLVIVAYFCARCYFFVESLISLRSLPPSAYVAVRWSNFLPHSG